MHRLAQWPPAQLPSPYRRSPQGNLGRRKGRDCVRLGVERLEERTLLSGNPTIAWDTEAGDFEWFTPLNWTEDRPPNPEDDLLIQIPDQQATITVSGSPTVRSLQSEESLQWLVASEGPRGTSPVQAPDEAGPGYRVGQAEQRPAARHPE